jgi:hypothetical protein
MGWETKIRMVKAAARETNEGLGTMLTEAPGGDMLSYNTWRVIVGLIASGYILPSKRTAPVLNRVCAALSAAAAEGDVEDLDRIEREA